MKMKKKSIISGIIVVIVISVFLIIRFVSRNKGIIITQKTVMKMGRRAGFDMDDPVNFGRQVEGKYDKLTLEQSRKVFHAILSVKEIPRFLKVLPPDLREEAIGRTAEWLGRYREGMTEEEKENLRENIKSPEGQKAVRKAQYSYFDGYSAEERAEIVPVVDEVLKILSEL